MKKRTRRFTPIFMIAVGIAMIGFWMTALSSDAVPEAKSSPVSLSFHLIAEILTALLLLAGGLLLLRGRKSGRPTALLAFGMLLYSLFAAAGYYAQRQEIAVTALFAALLVAVILQAMRLFMKKEG